MNKIYTIEELVSIQQELDKFIHFVKKYDSKPLPRCFHFCDLIIKNIGICKKNTWDGIEELSEYILQDWEAAMEIHTGLPEYYILGETNLETQKLNEEIKNIEDCRFTVTLAKSDLIDAIVTDYSLYETGNGRSYYEFNWGAFPQNEYDELKRIAFEANATLDEINSLQCTDFLKL